MRDSAADHETDRQRRWRLAVAQFSAGDKAGALYILKRLAMEGVQQAYVQIGKIYEIGGGGVEPNFGEAVRWYRKATYESDNVHGYLCLARMYYQGKGVDVNYGEAYRLYSIAVNNDKPVAHLMLARMHWLGRGTEQNSQIAIEHYKRAIELGNVIALQELGHIYRKSGGYWRGLWYGVIAAVRILWIGLRNPIDRRIEQI